MYVVVNGKQMELAEATTLAELIQIMGLSDAKIAVEINTEIVRRSDHRKHILNTADRIEIVHAVGGG